MELEQLAEELRKLSAENAALRQELGSLKESQNGENAQLREEIDSLKTSVASLETYITEAPPFTIAVDRFEQLKKSDSAFTSRPFYTHPRGYRMCIKVWANGLLDGKGSYVSVACHLLKGERDDQLKWPFCGNVHLRLMNQRGDQHHYDHFIRYTHRTPQYIGGRVTKGESSQGNNLVQFIPHSELANSATGRSFLVDNTLEFYVTKVELR